jgi:hypothetical protein
VRLCKKLNNGKLGEKCSSQMNTLAYFSDAAMPNKKVLYDSIVVMSEYFPSHLNNTVPILKDKNK